LPTLRTSPLGLKLIEAFEHDKLIGYKCPAGVPTISRGITGPALQEAGLVINYVGGRVSDEVFIGGRITQAESDRLYRELIDFFENKVERLLGRAIVEKLEPHQFDALVSLAWNIGLGSFAKSTLLRKIKAGQFDAVPQQFMPWNKATVKGVRKEMAGLTRRRRAEAALWQGDLEDAESYLGMKLGRMPQRVEEPEPPKTMAESTIGQGTIIAGAGGTITAGKEIVDQIQDAVFTGTSLLDAVISAGPWVLIAIMIAAAAWYVWNERKRKLKEDLV
jgi:lysozyme